MAFGFNPHYTQDMGLEGHSPAQFLALCVATAQTLDWNIRHTSDAGLIALTSKKLHARKQKFNESIGSY